MLRSNAPRVIKVDLLPPRTLVYYFFKEAKQVKLNEGFVDEVRDHIVIFATPIGVDAILAAAGYRPSTRQDFG